MKYIEYNCKKRIGYITFLREEKRNALNDQFIKELSETITLAEKDNKCKIIIIQNKGNVFCAGADLKYLKEINLKKNKENITDSKNLQNLFDKISETKKITISKIKGHAIAGGCGIILCTDFNYCTNNSKFGFTEVKIGFVPAIVSIYSILRIGFAKTKKLFLSGEIINAEKAKEIGLVDDIMKKEKIDKKVEKIANNLCENVSSNSILQTKTILNEIKYIDLAKSKQLAVKLNASSRKTNSFKKGINAFLNKKSINW